MSWATYADLPTRHEFYDAGKPQYPLLIPSGIEITIKETTVERRYPGLATEEVVFKHYIDLS